MALPDRGAIGRLLQDISKQQIQSIPELIETSCDANEDAVDYLWKDRKVKLDGAGASLDEVTSLLDGLSGSRLQIETYLSEVRSALTNKLITSTKWHIMMQAKLICKELRKTQYLRRLSCIFNEMDVHETCKEHIRPIQALNAKFLKLREQFPTEKDLEMQDDLTLESLEISKDQLRAGWKSFPDWRQRFVNNQTRNLLSQREHFLTKNHYALQTTTYLQDAEHYYNDHVKHADIWRTNQLVRCHKLAERQTKQTAAQNACDDFLSLLVVSQFKLSQIAMDQIAISTTKRGRQVPTMAEIEGQRAKVEAMGRKYRRAVKDFNECCAREMTATQERQVRCLRGDISDLLKRTTEALTLNGGHFSRGGQGAQAL